MAEDDRRPADGKRLARFNAVAAFTSLERAVEAVEQLREAGLTADELSLLGREHAMRPGLGRLAESPTQTTGGVAKAAVAGIATGGVVGAALGAVGGAIVAAIPGVGIAVGAAAGFAALGGSAAGQIAGGLIGAEAGGRKAMMWEQTLHPLIELIERDHVLVGVHSDEEDRVATGQEVLDGLEPAQLHRLDADETFRPPGDLAAIADRTIPSTHPDHVGGQVGEDVVPTREGRKIGIEERDPDEPTRGE